MASGFSAYLRRDLLLAYRRRGDAASPLIFFIMVSTLIPLGITPESARLAEIAPGIIWVMALLATLLSIDAIFANDYQDGSLEQLLISPHLLAMPVLGKTAAHWMVTGLPLTLASPLLGVMLSLPAQGYVPMVASLALGTGCLSLIGSVGAALTVSLRKGGLLLSLLVMPCQHLYQGWRGEPTYILKLVRNSLRKNTECLYLTNLSTLVRY